MLLLSPNLKRSVEISNLCKKILSVEPGILQVSFINRNGRMIETTLNNSWESSRLTKQESEMLSMQCTLQLSMNKEFDEKLTRVRYTIIKRESTSDFIFPMFDGIIFVIIDNIVHIQAVDNRISDLISVYQSKIEDIEKDA